MSPPPDTPRPPPSDESGGRAGTGDEQGAPDSAEAPPGVSGSDVVRFLGALLGVLLVGITPNPPVTAADWVQILSGATLTAAVTTRAVFEWARNVGSGLARRLKDRRTWQWVLGAVLLAGVVAVVVPLLVDAGRDAWYRVRGCPHPVVLRLVAEPGTVATAEELGRAYERASAEADHGCPSAQVFVFAADTADVTGALAAGDGWGAGPLEELGPRPDVWLASTAHTVEGLPAGPGPDLVADHVTVARSPLVLAVAAPVHPPGEQPGKQIGEQPVEQPEVGWSALVRDRTDREERVVRPDPVANPLGMLGTALLYGPPAAPGTPGAPPAGPDQIGEIERRLDSAQDTATYLCGRRSPDTATTPPTAVIASEQEVARYNAGLPLGASCGRSPDVPPERRLVALYPTDTGDQDLQFVTLGWSDRVQKAAAVSLRTWLQGDDGAAALVRTGLRPMAPPAWSAPLTTEYGVDPTGSPASQPLGPERWTRAETAYATAQRPNRLLFLLDTSSTMSRPLVDDPRPRGRIATDAVRAGINRLGGKDEFGLWFFPGTTAVGYTEAVPLGPRTDASVAAAGVALNDAGAQGDTPLFPTLVDGATALPEDDRFGVRALVVLTDGGDVGGGTAASTAQEVADRGVQVVIVTMGRARCAAGGLPTIIGATGGVCADADAATATAVVEEKVTGLRGGR